MSTMNTACRNVRRLILEASAQSGHGHIPTSFSIVEMLYAAYTVMRHDSARPDWDERDIFVLSKGHGALAYYAVLAQAGYFPVEELQTFGAFGSRLGCHPDRHKVPGVEVSTGSLGHGIAVAAGMALALKMKGSSRRVITLIGDGEANEGSVWEALMVAAHQRLDNLTVLLDYNRSQSRSLPIPNPAERFRAFGCNTHEVDGHDVEALQAALRSPSATVRAIVAQTIKGHGCVTLCEHMFEWHRRSPKPEELSLLLNELESS
jgi:transketolase